MQNLPFYTIVFKNKCFENRVLTGPFEKNSTDSTYFWEKQTYWQDLFLTLKKGYCQYLYFFLIFPLINWNFDCNGMWTCFGCCFRSFHVFMDNGKHAECCFCRCQFFQVLTVPRKSWRLKLACTDSILKFWHKCQL